MPADSCIFCKIINRTIPSTIVLENDSVIVIKDIAPKAPIHNLILPKKHIKDMASFTPDDASLVWSMTQAVQELGINVAPNRAFNLIVNNGAAAGQLVFHVHWHFLAGKNLYSSEFSL